MKIAVVDFDKTLIKVDSTATMLVGGWWRASFPILVWGFLLFITRHFLPNERQLFFRRKFRHALFRKIYQQGFEKVITTYADKLAGEINEKLIDHVRAHYDQVYVSTSAWKELVEAVLAKRKITDWIVQGTEYNPDFKQFSTCWHQEKVRRLRATDIEHFDVFTDSEEDRPLMNAADQVFLVTGDKFTPYV